MDFPCGNERSRLSGGGGGGYEPFNIDFYGIWATKAEIGDREQREIFLAFGSSYLGREKPLLCRERPKIQERSPTSRTAYRKKVGFE